MLGMKLPYKKYSQKKRRLDMFQKDRYNSQLCIEYNDNDQSSWDSW